MIGKDAITGR